jgi:hypothetical protein
MAGKPTAKTVKKLAMTRMNTTKQNEENALFIHERQLFIDKFTLCDVTCKAYIEKYKEVKKTAEDGSEIKLVLDMRTIPYALSFFELEIPKHVLTPVFGANKGKGQKTCKKIRDGIVHAMNISDLQEMHDRYDQVMAMMDTFLSYFQ